MIQITNYRGFLKEILKAIIKLCIAGFLIGFLKSNDAIIAIILLLKIGLETGVVLPTKL